MCRIACVLLLAFAISADARPVKKRGHAHRTAPGVREAAYDANVINNADTAVPVTPGARGSAVLRAQILLTRAHFSCGEIDGHYGKNFARALAGLQTSRALPSSEVVDAQTWSALNSDRAAAVVLYEITPQDAAGPFEQVPEDMLEKAKLAALGYQSPLEGLAEKFHSSPMLLQALNPGKRFSTAGEKILVPNVAAPPPPKAAWIEVSKSQLTVTALDQGGKILVQYPASAGSEHDPLPIGKWKIEGIRKNPDFHYNPALFWDAKEGDTKARIAPGPNNPVGVVWIDLSKPHYGIHGTPEPSSIGRTQSHGCIRLTNWDAWELAQIVGPGTPAILKE